MLDSVLENPADPSGLLLHFLLQIQAFYMALLSVTLVDNYYLYVYCLYFLKIGTTVATFQSAGRTLFFVDF